VRNVFLVDVKGRDEYQEFEDVIEGEKNHKKGGLNCVFKNFFLYVLKNCSQIQSLK